MITLRTLGESLIEIDGTRLSPESDVLFTVLFYLTAERDRRLSRAAVAELFWPELPPSRARHCLRQVLYRLRALGLTLDAEHEHLLVPTAHVAPTFAAAPSRERFDAERRAGTLTLGPLLAGHVPDVSPAFTEWFDGHRGHVHFHVRRVLLEAARDHRLRGEWDDVERLARECLRLDPLNEEATLLLAGSMVMVGGKAEAIAYLDRYIAELGGEASNARLPAAVLRRRIAERFPTRRYAGPADRCFVGRAGLLATVATALLRARNGDGGAAMLWGAAGVGKSRIASEVTKIAAVEGVRVLRVHCEESAAARPLAVFLELIPELLGCPGAIGCAPSSLAFLKRLLQLDPAPSRPAGEVFDTATLSVNVQRAVVDLVDAVSDEVPLLLLVEDAHWADPPSWAVLRTLVDWAAKRPLLVLLTSRTRHPTPSAPGRATTRLELHEVPPLDDVAAAELVRSVAADASLELPADAERWCLEAGEGNPLFLQELAGHWVETGQTRGTPPSLQTLLDARLARLTPSARRVLQASAVLGAYASTERIEAVLGLPAHVLVGALDELATEQLIVDREDGVAPRHEAVARVALGGLKDAALRLLHRRAAMVLEREVEATPSLDVLAQCYEHWTRGGRAGRACDALCANTTRILDTGAAEKVLTLIDSAIAQSLPECERENALRTRATVEMHGSMLHRAAHTLRDLTERTQVSSSTRIAIDRLRSACLQWKLGTHGELLFPDIRRLASERDLDPSARLEAISLGLAIADNEGASDMARWLWTQASALPLRTGDCARTGARVRMIYHCGFGDPTAGVAAARELQRLSEDEVDTSSRIKLFLNVADAERFCGDRTNSLPLLTDAYRLARRSSIDYLAVVAADKAASAYIEAGDLASATLWLDRASAHAAHCDDVDSAFDPLLTRARLLLAQGEYLACTSAWVQVAELAGATLSARRRRSALTFQALLALSTSDAPLHARLMEELRELHELLCRRTAHDTTAFVIAESFKRAGQKHEARSLLSAYLFEYRRGYHTTPDYLYKLLEWAKA